MNRGGPHSHHGPSTLRLGAAGDRAASFWVPRSGNHLHHHPEDGGKRLRSPPRHSTPDAGGDWVMPAVIGHKLVKRAQRRSPDGAGLALAFLYYYLCCRMHAGCHHTGTATKPSCPGQWQPSRPAQREPLVSARFRNPHGRQRLGMATADAAPAREMHRGAGAAQLSPLKN